MKLINLVRQPTGDTCTSACLAMITGIGVEDVINEFHQKWKDQESNPSEFLKVHGFEHEIHTDPFNNCVDWGYVYLVTVPSLNIEGGLHHIILDTSGDSEMVYDPNNGKKDKRYYVNWTRKDVKHNEVKLHAWIVDIKINPELISESYNETNP